MAHKGRRSSREERVQAMHLIAQGYTKRGIANILQVAEASVYGRQKAYQKGGLAALSTKIASGRKRLNASGFKAKRLSVGSAPGCAV
jgi:transposase